MYVHIRAEVQRASLLSFDAANDKQERPTPDIRCCRCVSPSSCVHTFMLLLITRGRQTLDSLANQEIKVAWSHRRRLAILDGDPSRLSLHHILRGLAMIMSMRLLSTSTPSPYELLRDHQSEVAREDDRRQCRHLADTNAHCSGRPGGCCQDQLSEDIPCKENEPVRSEESNARDASLSRTYGGLQVKDSVR